MANETACPSVTTEKTPESRVIENETGSMTETTEYLYDDYRQVTRTVRRVGGDTETTVVKYPWFCPNAEPYRSMVSRHMVAFPVERRVYRGTGLVSSELTTWKVNPSNGDFVRDKVYTAKLTSPSDEPNYYTGGTVSSVYGAPDMTFTAYDGWSNPRESLGRDGVHVAYYWERGKDNPSAVFTGARNSRTATSSDVSATDTFLPMAGQSNSYSLQFTLSEPRQVSVSMYTDGQSANRAVFMLDTYNEFAVASIPSAYSGIYPWSMYTGLPTTVSKTVPAGTHSLVLSNYSSSASSGVVCAISIEYADYTTTYTGTTDCHFEGFEDGNGNVSGGYLSGNSFRGSYTVPVTLPSDRTYSVDYRVRQTEGTWLYV